MIKNKICGVFFRFWLFAAVFLYSMTVGTVAKAAESECASRLKQSLKEQEYVRDVVVAVIDTGLDYEGFSYIDRVLGDTSVTDENGHGTLMAEIIAQNSGDSVKILPFKVADEEGKTTVEEVCRAIRKAKETGVDIINLSMNTLNSKKSELLENTIEQAVASGVVVVVSAGNKACDVKNISPSNVSDATVISAVDDSGVIASYSNYGDTVDYSAPGTYCGRRGTSYAAAYYSGVLAEMLSKGLSAEYLDDYLYDYGEAGWDVYYGKGVVSLSAFESDDPFCDFFGDEWEEQEESAIFSMGDSSHLTDAKIDEIILQSDLADVGYYLSGLAEEEKEELLSRDTILTQTVIFCEGEVSGESLSDADEIRLTEKEECLYYEKCLAEYEEESNLLRASAKYLNKTGYFNLAIDDQTGAGLSTTYQIHARVCYENKSLSGNDLTSGKLDSRTVTELGEKSNKLTVWSTVATGGSDTLSLSWSKTGGYYALFEKDDDGKGGRIFVPNISVTCPAYTLMYAKDSYHPTGECSGRGNYFEYTAQNTYTYKENREKNHLRKYGMLTSATTQLIKPQVNTTHMNLSDSARKKGLSGSICTMYIVLNNPKITVTVNPNGEKWGGITEKSQIEVINGKTYDLGKTTVTNFKASFYGGGDSLDTVTDTVVVTDREFSSWSLSYRANGSGEYGSNHSTVSGTILTAGTIEYDKQSPKEATTGEAVEVTAVFSGSYTITFPKAPTRAGYAFAGWYTGAVSGSGVLACSSAAAGTATVTLTADTSYHAEWTKNNYTVSYYNGENCLASRTYPYRTDIDLSVSEEKQEGDDFYYEQQIAAGESITLHNGAYVLVGWSLAPDGAVIASVNVPANSNTRLYAVWSMPTSGMKEVSVKVKSEDGEGRVVIPTTGTAAVNSTLGLKAYLYQGNIAIGILGGTITVTADGYSYAEDRAGNKTPLSGLSEGKEFPVLYTFQYKSYVYNPVTDSWDYLENCDVTEMAEVDPSGSYTYCFSKEMLMDAPYGYTYDHAQYAGDTVSLPYNLTVTNDGTESDTVLTAEIYYYPVSCTVTFDANGGFFGEERCGELFCVSEDGRLATKEVLYGSLIGVFPSAEMSAIYSCTGFYDKTESGNLASANDVVSGDMVLYAQWEAKSGIVRYDAGCNLGTVEGTETFETDVVCGSEIAYASYTAARTQYEFLGWSKEAQNIPEDGSVELLSTAEDALMLESESMTLYAQFARTLSIRFHQWNQTEEALCENGNVPVLYNLESEKTVIAPVMLAKEGWETYGWTTAAACGDNYEVGERTQIAVSDDADYYAVYRRTVTLTYDAAIPEDAGSVVFDGTDTAYAYCSTAGGDDLCAEFLIKSAPDREYYTFLYWESPEGEQYEPGESYKSVEDLTLTAVWEPNQAIVIYDAGTNGGTLDDEAEKTISFDYQSVIPIDCDTYPAKKDGYEFVGWNTDPDAKTGMGKNPDVDADIVDDGVLTVYAIFKREITAYFYQQGETEAYSLTENLYNNETSVTFHAAAIDEYEGWSPVGWTTQKEAAAAVELCEDCDFELAEDTSFYALYEKAVTLSYDTGVTSLVIAPEQGVVRHNTSELSESKDEPAIFLLAGMIEQEKKSFLYWEDTDGLRKEAGEEIELYEDETFTAIWDLCPEILAMDRYFTLEQANDPNSTYINPDTLLDTRYVTVTDGEDDDEALTIQLIGYYEEEFLALDGSADILIGYLAEDSYGHSSVTYATIHVVDTAAKEETAAKETRFFSEDYYKKDGNDVTAEEGGLWDTSVWRTEDTYINLLSQAIQNAAAKEPTVRYYTYYTMDEVQQMQIGLLGGK